ncbi:MAG: T9SS type A sorting domain-containing protein, partial [Bacteroidia bacterium]|nr:T9SS type A sorting domain-containing protein [Bacteroidia bacterium]
RLIKSKNILICPLEWGLGHAARMIPVARKLQDSGNNIFTGDGTFTLSSGGGIILGNSGGISSSGATGNIQVTATRSFSTGANYTYSGTTAQITGTGLPSQVNNLTFNNSSGFTLTNSVIVASTLTFTSGNLTTVSDTITLGTAQSNTGTLIRTSGHVIGHIKRWFSSSTVNNILFPVGTASYYEGAKVSITSVPSGGTVTANFLDSMNAYYGLQVPDGGLMIGTIGRGYWEFAPGNSMSGGAYTLDLDANSLAPVMTDYTQMHVIRKAILADPWTVSGTHAAGTGSNANPVAHRTGVTAWGIFAIGSAVGFPLPVELIQFDAKPRGAEVECLWATASEINNDNFTIERSADGKRFIALETIVGAGNSNTILNYSFTDSRPLNGMNYYRLKQTDFDGKSTYSPVKSVMLKTNIPGTTLSINGVNPNPFRSSFSISYTVEDNSVVQISIMNTRGQVVFSKKQNAAEGSNRFDYNDNLNLPSGIYFAKLILNNEVQIQKLVKN